MDNVNIKTKARTKSALGIVAPLGIAMWKMIISVGGQKGGKRTDLIDRQKGETMNSGQLRHMIMRVYGVSQDQAEGIMDVIETIADNLKRTYMKGVKDGFMAARNGEQDG